MEAHIRLLHRKKERLEDLIELARKGEKEMNLQAFNDKDYEEEVKARWGHTEAYKESLERAKVKDPRKAGEALMEHFAELGTLKHEDPASRKVQERIGELQSFITENFYTCTMEILSGLGRMYVDDERFRKNIDLRGGEGTAAFVSSAIEIYAKK